MDDLLDLDFTKSASTSKSPAAGNYGSSSGKSAFDYLAKSTASTSSYNSSNTRTTTPLQSLPPQTKSNVNTGGGDAFSSLFGNTSTSTSNGVATGSTLSMAERLAKDRATSPSFGGGGGGTSYNSNSRSSSPSLQSIQQQPPIRNQSPSLSNPRFSTPPIRSNAPSPAPAPAFVSTTGSKKASDPWDFDLLSSTVPSSTSNTNANDPLFDLGFEQTLTSPSNPTLSSPSNTSPLSPTPTAPSDEFDLLGAFSQPAKPSTATTNNLSNPSPSPSPSLSKSTSTTPQKRTVNSPPPEMLLKLSTELGFSLQDSNRVLIEVFEKTGKFSLEDAVESLMMMMNSDSPQQLRSEVGGRGVTRNGKVRREIDEWGEEENVRIGRRRSWELEEEEEEEDIERRRRQQQRSRAEVSQAKTRRSQQETNEKTDHDHHQREREVSLEQLNAKVLQDQAQQALAQASKIGLNMFKSANAYWGAGKEALSKKLEEQRKAARIAAGLPPGSTGVGGGGGATSTGGDSGRSDGRPKWWKEGMDLGEEEQAKSASTSRRNGKQREEETTKNEVSGFKDSDDEGVESVLPPRRPPQAQSQPHPQQKAATSTTDPTAEYRSPFRRAKATAPVPQPVEADLLSGNVSRPDEPTRRSTPPSSLPAPRSSRPSPTPPSSSSAPSSRPSVSIPPSVLSTAITHKQTGNSQFKLGNYSSATESYSLALDLLPRDWIGRVLLLNNRAQSRLKNGGEEKLAILDCQESIRILTGSDGKEINVQSLERESQSLGKEVHELAGGAGIDLRDQLGKSLGRRAKSFEMIEKWKDAMKDWETIRKLGDEVVVRGAGGSKLVGEGVERCRKVIDPPSSSASVSSTQASRSSTSTTTRSTSTTSTTTVKKKRVEVEGSGEAVKALQASQALQLAEEDLRLQLKDQVDSRILSWKSNKETNLRALIASLDQVLWEELGWKKVGMNELITENQLKVRYVRAIAKVHPDKLNVGNTTVEQRMIAGAVFAALNEAWNATKA
ncbi:hypothetical protein JCM5350_004112 [Sporobolomyces pararoseus]